MFTTDELISELEQSDEATQCRLIEQAVSHLSDETFQQLKVRANDLLGTDIARGIRLADNIIYASKISGKPIHRALGLMVQANAFMWQGKQREAILLYDEAHQVALVAQSQVEAARSQIGKIAALSRLGEYEQALQIAKQTIEVFSDLKEFFSVANTCINAAYCYGKLQQHHKALEQLQIARKLLEEIDTIVARKQLRFVLHNISTNLRDLGRYREALIYSLEACEIAEEYGFEAEKAIYQQSTATCYYLIGDYNKALRLLHDAHAILEKNNLNPILADCNYYLVECYLELGRYEEAVDQARLALDLAQQHDLTVTNTNALLHLSLSWGLTALHKTDEAVIVLSAVQSLVEILDIEYIKQYVQLRLAEIYIIQNEAEQAEKLLRVLAQAQDNPKLQALAQLLLVRIEPALSNLADSQLLVEAAIAIFQNEKLQSGLHQSYHQLGLIYEKQNNLTMALEYVERSIEQLEQLRGHIASEARSIFLRSKEVVYEDAVSLHLLIGQPAHAFHTVERVKSRALVELVGNQLDIRVRIRAEPDRPLVEKIEKLRISHNDLTRRLAHWQVDLSTEFQLAANQKQILIQDLHQCEKSLDKLTEQLQIRNASYAEDATLAATYVPFDFHLLEADQVLVEYYVARGKLLAFVVTRDGVKLAQELATIGQLHRELTLFRLNLAALAKRKLGELISEGLINNSKVILQKLYNLLIAPIKAALGSHARLLIVPHQSLHYLPFHALYDSSRQEYLLQSFEQLSYLPSASFLGLCQARAKQPSGKGALVFGFSNNGVLPCTVQEAHSVAAILQNIECSLQVEEMACLGHFRNEAPSKQIIHLATHGSYRADAPLFSSLLLADGELTGHELFNMELKASLITLSACDSGLGSLGGGDEIIGLNRACLYAGANSLALSLWQINDQAGSLLMQTFYSYLLSGHTKAGALRQAQLDLLANPAYQHPFYWDPFVLIGDSGKL